MTTPSAAALTEQERARLTYANEGTLDYEVIETIQAIILARLADSRPVVSEAAIRACAIHLFTVDRDRKGRGLVDWMYASDYEKDFFTAEAKAALTAALPHMGGGKGDAEWNGDKRAGGWLGKHDPAEMNTLARIVTDNAGERHPLFSVRYGIAVALLESDWLADKQADAWDEGARSVYEQLAAHGWTLEFYLDDNPYRLSPTGDDTP